MNSNHPTTTGSTSIQLTALLAVTPIQAASLLFELAGYGLDVDDACVESLGLDGLSSTTEHGHYGLGGVADLLDDGYPWTLIPADDDTFGAYLQRMGPDDASGVWVAVLPSR